MKYKHLYYYYSYLPRTNHFYFTFYLSFPLMCTQHTHTTDRDCLSYSFSVDVCSIYLNIVSSHNIIFEPYCDCHVPSHINISMVIDSGLPYAEIPHLREMCVSLRWAQKQYAARWYPLKAISIPVLWYTCSPWIQLDKKSHTRFHQQQKRDVNK